MPSSGTFKRVDEPYASGSYTMSLTLSADKHFTIETLLLSHTENVETGLPTTYKRTFVYTGDSYDTFDDEGRHIIAFHFKTRDGEENDGFLDYELRGASTQSIKLSAVGDSHTFEMRRSTR